MACATVIALTGGFLINMVTALSGSYWMVAILLCNLLCLAGIALVCFVSVRGENRLEVQLRRTIGHLRTMAENVPGALFQWFMSPDGGYGLRYISPRADELLGINPELAVSDWKHLHLHPGDIARWAESLGRASKSMEDWAFEGRIVMPDGFVKWVRCLAKPVKEKDGTVVFNGIILDITDAKDTEREMKEIRRNSERLGAEILLVNQSLNETNETLKRINQQKNEILGVAAHDLKNPLGGVVGFAGAVRMTLDEPDLEAVRKDLVEMSESIECSARHMLNIINGLLDASALEDGTVELMRSPCDMALLVQSVESMNEVALTRKNISILTDCENSCVVNGDPQRLRELIDNLVSNAIKYSQAGSRVWISARHKDLNGIIFSVRDEGPGLTDDDKKRLFGKFQKLSARPTAGESSTGLGLSIAKSIVELHGGHIWAESQLGQGSTFHVELPINPTGSSFKAFKPF